MPRAPRTLYLVDGNAQFHRAYFAIRGLSTSRGLPTGATYGFTTMLRKLLADEDPQWLGIAFDPPGRTFRHEQFAEYKANRPKMADDLVVQVPYVRRVCDVLRLPILEVPGFEADDVLATLARQACAQGLKVVIVSADKDLLQLVDDQVQVLSPGREGAVRFDAQKVHEKWGVLPGRIVDMLALVGDAVDNVPGVAGIGEKGATELLQQYGSLDELLRQAGEVKRKSYRDGLQQHRQDALLSRQLVTLRSDAPIALDLRALARHEPDRPAAQALFIELEFAALAKEYAPPPSAVTLVSEDVRGEQALAAVVGSAAQARPLSMHLLTSSREPMRGDLLGLGLAWEAGRACYVPLSASVFDSADDLKPESALQLLRPLLEDPALPKTAYNAKLARVALARQGVKLAGVVFDVLLAAYLLNPGRRSYGLGELAGEFLGENRPGDLGSVRGAAAAPEACAGAAAEAAELVLRLTPVLRERLEQDGLAPIFETLELPLATLLGDMELAGVKIDVPLLRGMSRDMQRQLDELTRQIYVLAGGEFNINSPVQLRELLFDRLGLKAGKKTAKTRAASTAEAVLEELAREHELPRRILDYRAVQKLKSTYVDALPELVLPSTGRIHALLNQTVAATGRLSTSDPNLQNIPIRTALGRRIREAFVAEPGFVLLSADYSQVELRILAHLSKDETLIDTFRRGEDVHERTAREIFGAFSALPEDEQRRVAKMVNYALLYGKTAFTLAKDLGVSRGEAQAFIVAYFSRYPKVRGFIEATLHDARASGLVRTLLGRLRRLPDLQARNPQVRAEAERQAINTPVQGSAADLIKKAMLDLEAALREKGLRSRLVLQIHDELLLEVPEQETEVALGLVREIMEGALKLDVPLVVDARVGRTWAEAH